MCLRKLALSLAAVGLVYLPAPVHLPAPTDAIPPPSKVSNSHRAETVLPADQSDTETIVSRHGRSVLIPVYQASQRYSAGKYRAPNETHETLEVVMRNGTIRTAAAGTQADLRVIAWDNTYAHDAYGEHEQYYRFHVRENGSVVIVRNTTLQRVTNSTVERSAYSHVNLSPAARETVDSIPRNSSDGDPGYRLRMNDALVDRLPALVKKEGACYSITAYTHADDFGFETAFVVGLDVTGADAVLILVGGAVYAIAWRRE